MTEADGYRTVPLAEVETAFEAAGLDADDEDADDESDADE